MNDNAFESRGVSRAALLERINQIAIEAGALIIGHYQNQKAGTATYKADRSPLTEADLASNRHILSELEKLEPSIPIISEETPIPDYEARKNWERFWLVDPLDGTKEFLKGKDEFTVNIALIEHGEPVVGVVFIPARNLLYYAAKGLGAFRVANGDAPVRITSAPPVVSEGLIVAESASHPSAELEAFLNTIRVKERVQAGSSLKFCLVAEGAADIYPRLNPTMEWDVAAGDCIYRNSAPRGQRVSSLSYNKPTLRNEGFIIGWEDRVETDEMTGHSPEEPHVVWHSHSVPRSEREALNGHKGCVLWFTGLSACGKSTIANLVDHKLSRRGVHSFLLDGDNVRHGLNAGPAMLKERHGESFAQRFGLGFSAEDREENIRRIGTVAKLFADAGLVTLTAFISPYRRDRDRVRAAMTQGDFIEIFVDAPLEICEKRDPKGLYKEARAGRITSFTGIDAPYEPPLRPELVLDTGHGKAPEALADEVISYLEGRGVLPKTAKESQPLSSLEEWPTGFSRSMTAV